MGGWWESNDDAIRIGGLQFLGLGKQRHLFGKLEFVCFRKNALALPSLHGTNSRESLCFGTPSARKQERKVGQHQCQPSVSLNLPGVCQSAQV